MFAEMVKLYRVILGDGLEYKKLYPGRNKVHDNGGRVPGVS